MGSRMVINGRVVHDTIRGPREVLLTRRKRVAGVVEDHPIDPNPIPADSPASPFREGTPWQDPDTGLGFRVLARLDHLDGWGTLEHWVKRWQITYATFIELCQHGLLDCAIEAGSAVRRYRCRDEAAVLAKLEVGSRVSRWRLNHSLREARKRGRQ